MGCAAEASKQDGSRSAEAGKLRPQLLPPPRARGRKRKKEIRPDTRIGTPSQKLPRAAHLLGSFSPALMCCALPLAAPMC